MSCLELAFHPNGQPYKEHWTACKATVDQQNGTIAFLNQQLGAAQARIKKLLAKCGSKCKGL